MAPPSRTFTDSPAVRRQVPLFVGIVGPSGSGKTMSALRLAAGMQKVCGGDVWGIDTEADRMLHYADVFKFRHVPFAAPFDPLSYLAAVEHCVKKGAKTIIIDSASHLHEGPGGTLETHESELQRIAGDDWAKRQRCTMLAWQKPKADLRRFLNSVLQMHANLIFCFRAKDKMKMEKGQDPKPLGFMPIAGDEMFYEMALSCLLYPGSGGVPTWQSNETGEKVVIKQPRQFADLFKDRKPLDEATGEALAKWAAGGAAATGNPTGSAPESTSSATAPAAAASAIEMLLSQLTANGHRTKAAQWEWMCRVAGRQTTREAPLTEAECEKCIAQAELEAAK